MIFEDTRTSDIAPRLLDQQSSPTSIRRWVYFIFFASWIVRFAFIGIPVQLSRDEVLAINAGSAKSVSEFIETSNWAIRWHIVESISLGGRIGWILAHLLWGYLFPNSGSMAYLLNTLMAMVAMLALAGAARRLFGERGYLLTLLLASVSPLFLNYTIRVLGSMPSVVFVCIAIFFFTSQRWNARNWIAGGFCLGLSFGTHYGVGSTILGIAFGLAVAILLKLIERGLTVRRKVWECLVCPALGVVSAILPLLLLELWARYAGSSYYGRLLTHENIVTSEWENLRGPTGMWLRHLFELDPLLEFFLILALLQTFQSSSFRRSPKVILALISLLLIVVVFLSLAGAPIRAYISILLFVVLGIAAYLTRLLDWRRLSRCIPTDPLDEPILESPILDIRCIAAAILAIAAIYFAPGLTALSEVPRLTFPSWPLFVLGLTGLMLKAFQNQFNAVIRLGSLAGMLILLLAAWALFQNKSIQERSSVYELHHPYRAKANFPDFLSAPATYDRLESRIGDNIEILGPSVWIYPASPYEEEFHKHVQINKQLREHKLEDRMNSYQLVYATVYFDRRGEGKITLLPPGTPMIPSGFRVLDSDGQDYPYHEHRDRGLEVQLPALDSGGEVKLSVDLDFNPKLGAENVIGFEHQALSSNGSPETRLTLSLKQGNQTIAMFDSEIRKDAGEWQFFKTPFTPVNEPETIEIELHLSVPEGEYCPPISSFIRRAAVWSRAPRKGALSDTAQTIAADEFVATYPSFTTIQSGLYFSRSSQGLKGKGISWQAEAWSGKSSDPLVFAGSHEFAPVCRLSINGRPVMEFAPTATDETWNQNGFKLEYRHLNSDQGNHGIFMLALPEGSAILGAPIDINIKVAGGEVPHAWFGVRNLKNVMELLPENLGPPQ